ncbi:phage tail assembly chaperone [Rhodobacteraceae bacterium]|nr:phage tail assembly chaperone [Paracoccaceae bacterium]
MNRFDWVALMRSGAELGLRPREFWALTPAELAFLLGEGGGATPLSRARLEELAAAFPDREIGECDGGT